MAYVSYGTRKALGRRYGTDPALLLEAERLEQQYALSPGREAMGMQAAQFEASQAQQASQFAESMAFNERQASLNRASQEEANQQAGISSMVGTAGNVATGLPMTYYMGKSLGLWGDSPMINPATVGGGMTGVGMGAGGAGMAGAGAVVAPPFTAAELGLATSGASFTSGIGGAAGISGAGTIGTETIGGMSTLGTLGTVAGVIGGPLALYGLLGGFSDSGGTPLTQLTPEQFATQSVTGNLRNRPVMPGENEEPYPTSEEQKAMWVKHYDAWFTGMKEQYGQDVSRTKTAEEAWAQAKATSEITGLSRTIFGW